MLVSAGRRFVGAITAVETDARVAALTFDDGPHPYFTPRLLKILDTFNVQATFFMVGGAAQYHPDLVRRVAQAGHAIGNHSWDHPVFTSISSNLRRQQLRACQRVLAPYALPLFRPPYGHQNFSSNRDVRKLGYRVITWSAEVRDWQDDDAERMADRLKQEISPGSIVVLHDAIYRADDRHPVLYDRSAMLEAVTRLLESRNGLYRFVAIPELLAAGPPVIRTWYA